MRIALLAMVTMGLSVPALAQSQDAQQKPPSGTGMQAGQDDMPNMPGMDHAKPSGDGHDMSDMPGMDMQNMSGMASTGIFGSYPMTRDASGTSWQPDDAAHNGIHAMAGDWMLMGHMTLLGVYDNQSGPRGDEKVFPAGMLMGIARRDFSDSDTVNFRAMLSPDPFMGRSGYPSLLASGETANGVTHLIDRQHPHDLVMEMSGAYSHKFSGDDSAFLYFGYPGEPAMGPPAFMHRASGMDDPAAPITHHWLDSTHITFGVATAGFVHDDWKVEVSQFTGREPDQFRFNFDQPRFDSTAARISWNPDQHWSLQASWGHLNSPEQLDPTVDETRYTASAMYVNKFDDQSSIAATLAWGFKSLSDGTKLNGILLEGEYKPSDPWTAFARFEWEENSELAPGTNAISRVSAFSLGGIHDWRIAEHWKLGIGGLYAFDFAPGALNAAYGSDPHGAMAFVRIIAQ